MYATNRKPDGGTLNDLRNHILRLKQRADSTYAPSHRGSSVMGVVRTESNEHGMVGQEWHRESND
ncbi:MAG: hypothetical protein AAFV69_12525 [Pseudomonadota bacterium]